MDGQIRFENGYVCTWKFLNPEKKGADSKISGYMWTGSQYTYPGYQRFFSRVAGIFEGRAGSL